MRSSREKGVAHRKTLNARQLAVLQWICDGCPDGPIGGISARISAGALHNRGLVKTSGRGPTWTAVITDAGRDYLDSAAKPTAPAPRQANQSVTQALVNEVIAAGGTLQVPRQDYRRPGTPDYQRRAELAERYGNVPAGKQLVVKMLNRDELQIDLIDAPEGTYRTPQPVPVPQRVSQYHPVVQQFRTLSQRHEISRAALPRVLHVLHGLVTEAERRGYSVASAPDTPDLRSYQAVWMGASNGHVVIGIEGYTGRLRIHEEGLPGRAYHAPQTNSLIYGGGGRTVPSLREYEQGATGRLTISIVSGFPERRRASSWSDRKSSSLEDKLPNVLCEIEIRAAEDRHRKRIAEQQAAERERAWETAMQIARERHAEHHRATALTEQVRAWRQATEIRAYCDAAQRQGASEDAAARWIAWARGYADSLDPLRGALSEPDAPTKVPPEQLRPFLDGWNPYQPVRGAW